jgi:hypothetical protein
MNDDSGFAILVLVLMRARSHKPFALGIKTALVTSKAPLKIQAPFESGNQRP